MSMQQPAFRIEELNPFQEWHWHGSANSQEQAIQRARLICKKIGRTVRVLDSTHGLIIQIDSSGE